MSLNEPAMNNGDAVIAGNLYVANVGVGGTFVVTKSSVTGLVSDLKTATGATVIRKIDYATRMGGFPAPGSVVSNIFEV